MGLLDLLIFKLYLSLNIAITTIVLGNRATVGPKKTEIVVVNSLSICFTDFSNPYNLLTDTSK